MVEYTDISPLLLLGFMIRFCNCIFSGSEFLQKSWPATRAGVAYDIFRGKEII